MNNTFDVQGEVETALEDFRWEIRKALRDLKGAPDHASALPDLEEEVERASDILDAKVSIAVDNNDDDDDDSDDDVSEINTSAILDLKEEIERASDILNARVSDAVNTDSEMQAKVKTAFEDFQWETRQALRNLKQALDR